MSIHSVLVSVSLPSSEEKGGRELLTLWMRHWEHIFPLLNNGSVVAVHVMNAYRRSRGIAPLILNLGTRGIWVVNSTLPSLYYQYPSNRRLGGLHSRFRWFWSRRNFMPQPAFELRAVHPAASRYTHCAINFWNNSFRVHLLQKQIVFCTCQNQRIWYVEQKIIFHLYCFRHHNKQCFI